MKFKKTLFALCGAIMILTGCSSVTIDDYKSTQPTLEIENYFSGKTKAWGVFQDRFGKVRRQFVVDIDGKWDKDKQTLTLTEDFVYDDGEKEQRVWTITKTAENTYTGTAKNVVGMATGKSAGNAFNFKYTFNLPVQGDIWRVTFDDWMYLNPDGETLFNKATIKRFGITIGDVYIFFRK